MNMASGNFREKWDGLFNGGSADRMVSPLCDSWRLDIPYTWPFDCQDPYPPGHKYHSLSMQMAMAGFCGWDPMFIAGLSIGYTKDALTGRTKHYNKPGSNHKYEETRIETPYGDLTYVIARSDKTHREEKNWLTTKEDYQKIIWLMKERISSLDKDTAIADGKAMLKAVGNKGILGTFVAPPHNVFQNTNDMFYHLADWPDEYMEYMDTAEEYQMQLLDIYAEAGFDYIFIGMDGTDFLSPWFVEQYVLPPAKRLMAHWRKSGGKVMWHTCGHAGIYLEKGYFNDLQPDILETLSEPPVGNVKSLKWARELTNKNIITKGNMALDILLEGTEEEVRESVAHIKEQTKGYRHIVGLSDAVLENTPLKNCLAFVDEARR
jgi:hypothetical protein